MWSPVRSRSIVVRVAAFATSIAAACASAPPPARAQTPASESGAGAGTDADAAAPVDDPADMDPAALSEFQEPLAPYGTWTDDATYGTVWVPRADTVGSDFAPYVTAGHWSLTADDQWLWESDYPWGWAPFHYGRWVWIDGRGWGWIPGRVYAPAWVVWRTGVYDEPYVGWAPMPAGWYWRGGVAVRFGAPAPARYVFVPSRYAFQPAVRTYVVAPARVGVIAARTQPYVATRGSVAAYAVTRGPTLAAARVPAEAVPVRRVAPPARAVAAPVQRANVSAPPAHRGGGGRGGFRRR